MPKLGFMLVSLLFLIGSPAAAAGADRWLVTQLSGDARVVHPGLHPVSLKTNAEIAAGDVLITGATGRATLAHGADYIVVAPNSELRLPTAPEPSGFTHVIQKLGTMLFKVKHTGIPHFAVDTPMLAAVVKGTTFTVVVDQNRSAVQVIQGKVQVIAMDGGMSQMVEGGRTVFVDHNKPAMLRDADKPLPAAKGSSTGVQVSASAPLPLASIAQLTSGLVRAEAGTSQPTSSVVVTAPQVAAAAPTSSQPVTTGGAHAPTLASLATSTPAPSVGTASPAVTVSPVTTPAVTVAIVTSPAVTVPAVTTPAVTVPSVTTPAVTVPVVTTPVVTPPAVTVPAVTVPAVNTPTIATPVVTVPSVTIANVTTPTVTVPSVTVPTVTVPTITIPSVTVPTVTVPTVTVPSVTTPTITTPTITVPAVPVLTVTVPSVTVPSVTTPTITVPPPPLLGLFGH